MSDTVEVLRVERAYEDLQNGQPRYVRLRWFAHGVEIYEESFTLDAWGNPDKVVLEGAWAHVFAVLTRHLWPKDVDKEMG